jgi:hypothetical protein
MNLFFHIISSKFEQVRNSLLNKFIIPFAVQTNGGPAYFQYAHQKATMVENRHVSVFLDPFILDLKDQSYTNIVFGEILGKEFIESIQIPRAVIWHEFLISLLLLDTQTLRNCWFLLLLHRNMPSRDMPVHWILYSIRTLLIANYFSLKLRKVAETSNSAYVLVYYNAIMLGVVDAFRRLGKDVWDVQHGLLGPTHDAYNNSRAFKLKSSFIPNKFLVWNSDFGKHVESVLGVQCWKSTNYRHLNMFEQSSVFFERSDSILYTLQWTGPVPEEVEIAVRELKHIQWIFRRHPFESHNRPDLAWINEYDNAKVVDASEPLALSLSKCFLHITYISSVVFEASSLNIPSIILCKLESVAKIISRFNYLEEYKDLDPYILFAKPIAAKLAFVASDGELINLIINHYELGSALIHKKEKNQVMPPQ